MGLASCGITRIMTLLSSVSSLSGPPSKADMTIEESKADNFQATVIPPINIDSNLFLINVKPRYRKKYVEELR